MIRQLGEEQDQLERVIEQYEQSLRGFKPKQDQINKQQDKLAGILRRMGGAQPALAAEAFFFEYVGTLLTRTIERYQERTRSEVEKAASEMFVKLVHDPQAYQGLRISRDYRVDLVGQWGEAIKTSEGGKQLIALSLILSAPSSEPPCAAAPWCWTARSPDSIWSTAQTCSRPGFPS